MEEQREANDLACLFGQEHLGKTPRTKQMLAEPFLVKDDFVSKPFVRDAPVYQWFALPGLLMLGIGFGLRAIPYFIDYT